MSTIRTRRRVLDSADMPTSGARPFLLDSLEQRVVLCPWWTCRLGGVMSSRLSGRVGAFASLSPMLPASAPCGSSVRVRRPRRRRARDSPESETDAGWEVVVAAGGTAASGTDVRDRLLDSRPLIERDDCDGLDDEDSGDGAGSAGQTGQLDGAARATRREWRMRSCGKGHRRHHRHRHQHGGADTDDDCDAAKDTLVSPLVWTTAQRASPDPHVLRGTLRGLEWNGSTSPSGRSGSSPSESWSSSAPSAGSSPGTGGPTSTPTRRTL